MSRETGTPKALSAGLAAVLSGGNLYWLVIIKPNDGDTWTNIAFGNLSTASLAGYTVWTSKWLSISDIDNSASDDVIEDPLARIADMDFTLENTTGAITPSTYLGRIVEVRCGAGTTMSIATSDVFFTGRIYDAQSDRKNVTFTARGISQLKDKEIGEKVPGTVADKYKGRIQPMAWGDWTDEDAYLPLVLKNEISGIPTITLDVETWKDFGSLQLYDDKQKKGYAVNNTTQFNILSTENEIRFSLDTGAEVTNSIGVTDERIVCGSYGGIVYHESSGTDVPGQNVIQIDDEKMLILEEVAVVDSAGYYKVERGYMDTTPAVHLPTTPIYQITELATKFQIQMNAEFYAKGFAGIKKYKGTLITSNVNVLDVLNCKNGSVDDMRNPLGTGWCEYEFNSAYLGSWLNALSVGNQIIYTAGAYATNYLALLMDLIFEPIGFSGSVSKHYALFRGYSLVTPSSITGESAFCIITKNADFSAHYPTEKYLILASAIPSAVETTTEVFNNITGSDLKTGRDLSTVPGGSIALSDISDLNNTRYSLGYFFNSVYVDTIFQNRVFGVGFRIDFSVDPIEYDFYARAETRKHPGSYFNGSANDLIEAPSIVIEDFCRTCVMGMDSGDLDEGYFDSFHTDRSAWKLAASVYSDMEL